MRVLVEYCLADRSRLNSLSLRGSSTRYVELYQKLERSLVTLFPDIEIESNSLYLLDELDTATADFERKQSDTAVDALSANSHGLPSKAAEGGYPALHEYSQSPGGSRRRTPREPRVGAFEVYAEVDSYDHLTGAVVQRLTLAASKLQDKKFPTVPAIVSQISSAVDSHAARLVSRTVEEHSKLLAQHLLSTGDAHCDGTWCMAGARHFTVLPGLLERLHLWKHVKRTSNNVHWLAASVASVGLQVTRAAVARHVEGCRRAGGGGGKLRGMLDGVCKMLDHNARRIERQPMSIYVFASAARVADTKEACGRFLSAMKDIERLVTRGGKGREGGRFTAEELMLLGYAKVKLEWARRVGFTDTFEMLDQSFLSRLEAQVLAPLRLQSSGLIELLGSDGALSQSIVHGRFDPASPLAPLAPPARFHILTQATTLPSRESFRLALRLGEGGLQDDGEAVIDQVLSTIWAGHAHELSGVTFNISFVAESTGGGYIAVVDLEAPGGGGCTADAAYCLVRDMIERCGPEITSLLPEDGSLEFSSAASGGDAFLAMRLVLPRSSTDFTLERLEELIIEDLLSVSPHALTQESFAAVSANTHSAIVQVIEAGLPKGLSPEEVVRGIFKQATTQASTPPFFSQDRHVTRHVTSLWYTLGGAPPTDPSLPPPRARIAIASSAPDMRNELRCLDKAVLPQLRSDLIRSGSYDDVTWSDISPANGIEMCDGREWGTLRDALRHTHRLGGAGASGVACGVRACVALVGSRYGKSVSHEELRAAGEKGESRAAVNGGRSSSASMMLIRASVDAASKNGGSASKNGAGAGAVVMCRDQGWLESELVQDAVPDNVRYVFSEGGGKKQAVVGYAAELKRDAKVCVDYSLGFRRYHGGSGVGGAEGGGTAGEAEALANKIEVDGVERFGLAAYSSVASILLAASPPCADRIGGSPLEAHLTRQRVIRLEACESATSTQGGNLVDEITGYCTGGTSDAPAVIVVDGVHGSGRTTATARAAQRILEASTSHRYIASYFGQQKREEGGVEQVMEYLSGELWSQLIGGRHVRAGGGEKGWGGLCTAIEKCADEAQSIVPKEDAASSRVVLICDGIGEAEACTIAQHFLSRPRLFHRAVLVFTADLSSMSQRMRRIASHIQTVVLRVPRAAPDDSASLFRSLCERYAAEDGVLPPSLTDSDLGPLLDKPESWRPSFLNAAAYALISDARFRSKYSSEAIEEIKGSRQELLQSKLQSLDRRHGVSTMRSLLVPLMASPTSTTETEVRALSGMMDSDATHLLESIRPFLRVHPEGGLALLEDCYSTVLRRYVVRGGGGLGNISKVAENIAEVGAGVDGGRDLDEDEEEVELEEGGVEEYWARMEDEALTSDERRFNVWRIKEQKKEREAAQRLKRSGGVVPATTSPAISRSPKLKLTLNSPHRAPSTPPSIFIDSTYDRLLRRDSPPSSSFSSPAPHQHILYPKSTGGKKGKPSSAAARRPASAMGLGRGVDDSNNESYFGGSLVRRPASAGPKASTAFFPSLSSSLASPESLGGARAGRSGKVVGSRRGLFLGDSSGRLDEDWARKDAHTRSSIEGTWGTPTRSRSNASLRNRPASAASPSRGSAAPSPAPPPLPAGYLCELDEMRKSAMAERLLFDEEAQEELEEARPSLGGSPNPSRPSSAMSTASARKRRPASAMSGSSKSRTTSSSPIKTYTIEELAERERDRQMDLLRSIRLDAERERHIKSKMAMLKKVTRERDEARMSMMREREAEEKRSEREKREMSRHKLEQMISKKKLEDSARKREFDAFQHTNRTAALVSYNEQFDHERRELDRLTREALADRGLYDAYNREQAGKQEVEERERERREAREAREREEAQETEREELELRKARHEERLKANFGMLLTEEQVSAAAEHMPGFGVPIVRDDHPATIQIGGRRKAVTRHRGVKGRIFLTGSGGKQRIVEEVKTPHFTVATVPEGRFIRDLELFAMPMRFRVRYKDIKLIERTNDLDETSYEAQGQTRPKPMVVTLKGSDGYIARWTEAPIPDSPGEYCGMLVTDQIREANYGVTETLVVKGWVQKEGGEGAQIGGGWVEVQEEALFELFAEVK